jgi:hypothetical protein
VDLAEIGDRHAEHHLVDAGDEGAAVQQVAFQPPHDRRQIVADAGPHPVL